MQRHPGTNMAAAMAETVSPFAIRFDAGSAPVGDLAFSSDDPNIQLKDLQDAALFEVRPMFATSHDVSAPPPFGGARGRS